LHGRRLPKQKGRALLSQKANNTTCVRQRFSFCSRTNPCVSLVGALRATGEGLPGRCWWTEAYGDWRDAPWAAEGWQIDAWSCPVNNGGGSGCVLEGWELRGWGGAASAGWGGRVEVRHAVACAV